MSADAVNEAKGKVEPFATLAVLFTLLATVLVLVVGALSLFASGIDGQPEIVYPQDPALPVVAVSLTSLLAAFFEREQRRRRGRATRAVTALLITLSLPVTASASAVCLGAVAPVRTGIYVASTECGPVTALVGGSNPRSIVVQSQDCGVGGDCGVTVGFDGAFGYYNPGISVAPSGYRGHVNLDGSIDGQVLGSARYWRNAHGSVGTHSFHATPLPNGTAPQQAFSDYGCKAS